MLSPLHEDDKDKEIKDHLSDLYTTELQQRYVDAKAKVAEFTTTSNLALHLKVHGKLTCRVYSALSSLLFASLSIVKTEELERFILKRSTQLPSFLFNLDEWIRSIKIARNFRNSDRHRLVEKFLTLKKVSDSNLMEIKNKLFAAFVELKTTVRKELNQMDKLIKVYCEDIFRLLTLALKKSEREKSEINEKKKILVEELAASYEKNKKLQQDREDDAIAAKVLMEDNLKESARKHAEEIIAIQHANEEEKKRLTETLNNESECKQLELVKFYDEQHQSLVEQYQSQIRERDEVLEKEKNTTLNLQKTIKDMEKSYNDMIRSTNARIDFLSIQLQITNNNNTNLVEENVVKSTNIKEKETTINTLHQNIKDINKTHSDLIRSTNARIEFLSIQLETANNKNKELTSEIDLKSNALKEQQDQLTALQKKIKEMEKSYNDMVRSSNARIEFLSVQLDTANKGKEKMAFESEMKSVVIATHEQTGSQLRLTVKELERKLSDSLRSCNARIEFLSVQLGTATTNNANLKAENEFKRTVIQENESNITSLQQNLKDINKTHSDFIRSTNARIEFLSVQLETAKGNISDLTSEIDLKSNALKEQQDQLTALQKKIKEMEKSYNDMVRSSNARIEFLSVQLENATTNNTNLKAENEFKSIILQENETTISTLQQNLKDINKTHSDSIRSTNARIEFLSVQLETATGNISDLTSEIDLKSNALKEQQDQLTALQKKIKEMEKSYNDMVRSSNARIEFLSVQLDTVNKGKEKMAFESEMKSVVIATHEQTGSQLRLTVKELERKLSDSLRSCNARIEFLSVQLESTKRKCEDLLAENNGKDVTIGEHKTAITSLQQNLKDINKTHSDFIRSTNARIEFLSVQLETATGKGKEQQDQLTALQKKIKEMEKSYNDMVRSSNARIEFLSVQLETVAAKTTKLVEENEIHLKRVVSEADKKYYNSMRSTNARIEFLAVQLETAKTKCDRLQSENATLMDDANKASREKDKRLSDSLRSCNARIEFLSVQLETTKRKYEDLLAENKGKDVTIGEHETTIRNLKMHVNDIIRSTNARIEFLSVQLETAKEKNQVQQDQRTALQKKIKEMEKSYNDMVRSSNARIEFLSVQLETAAAKNMSPEPTGVNSEANREQLTALQKKIKEMEKSYNDIVRSSNARIEFLSVQLETAAAKNMSPEPTGVNSEANREQQDQLTALQKTIKDINKNHSDLIRSRNARIEFLSTQNATLTNEITSLRSSVGVEKEAGGAGAQGDVDTGNRSSHADATDTETELLGMKLSEALLELKKRRRVESSDNDSTVATLRNEIALLKQFQSDTQTAHEAAVASLQTEIQQLTTKSTEADAQNKVEKESLAKLLHEAQEKVEQQQSQLESERKEAREKVEQQQSQLESERKEAQEKVEQLQSQLESERKEAQEKVEQLQKRYDETHTALQSEIQHVSEIRELIDVEKIKLKKKQKKVAGLLLTISNMAQDLEKLERSMKSQTRAQEFANSTLLTDSSSLSSKSKKGIVRFQALVRGYMARSKYYKRRTREAASRAGILFALDKTEQGETGWYSAPDGSVFYFVAEKGEYLLACGPLTVSDYDRLLKKSEDISKHESKLIKCDIGLSIKDTGDDSDVYISSKSKKLFIVCPLDGRFFPPEDEDLDEGDSTDKPKGERREETIE